MPSIEQYLTESARQTLRDIIEDADGNEVFCVGRPNESGIIDEIQPVCRGTDRAVMVLFSVPKFGEVVIHNHPSGVLLPSEADEEIAFKFDGQGVGFFIVNNDVTDIYVLVEPFREGDGDEELNIPELLKLLRSDGPIASNFPNYEERPQQLKMLQMVAQTFNRENILMVEAGTGTGKSLAYLLPAIFWAQQNRRRVLISTNTINLQQQLLEKDIPLLKRALGQKIRAVLVKGRQNYLCLRKREKLRSEQTSLFSSDDAKDLLRWADSTTTGDKSELNYLPPEDVWSELKAEADECPRNKCEYYKSCFYYAARRKQAEADILITNHHVLFADLALRDSSENYHSAALLPPYRRIIIDEAHNIEDAVSGFLSRRFSRRGLLKTLSSLWKQNRQNKVTGLLQSILKILQKSKSSNLSFGEMIRSAEEMVLEDIIPHLIFLRRELETHTRKIQGILAEIPDTISDTSSSVRKIRIEFLRNSPIWPVFQEIGLKMTGELITLRNLLYKLNNILTKLHSRTKSKELKERAFDLNTVAERISNYIGTLHNFFQPTEELLSDWVLWVEWHDEKYYRLAFEMAPLNVGPHLQRMLFKPYGGIVLTSATLSTSRGNFSFFCQRFGLDGSEKLRTATFSSPFDYRKQALVGIPTDIPSPRDRNFSHRITELIFRAVESSGGRAFVLTTSFQLLTYLYKNLAPLFKEKLGINSYCQGEAPRHQILRHKIEDPTSVLFGTDSFWEGVDVRGEALTNVIITKLPFRVPSEPLIEARIEYLEKQGRNSFIEYTVPHAVIKFKQGFGRLIRSAEDRGTILILDNRIINKSYGSLFLKALPPQLNKVIDTGENIIEEFKKFHRKLELTPIF